MGEEIDGVTHNGLRRIYRVLCHLAWCDSDLAETERGFLNRFRERYGISLDEAEALEADGKAGKKLGVGKREEERALMLETMIDITMIDGMLAAQEQERLAKFASTFDLSREELAQRIVERASSSGRHIRPSD